MIDVKIGRLNIFQPEISLLCSKKKRVRAYSWIYNFLYFFLPEKAPRNPPCWLGAAIAETFSREGFHLFHFMFYEWYSLNTDLCGRKFSFLVSEPQGIYMWTGSGISQGKWFLLYAGSVFTTPKVVLTLTEVVLTTTGSGSYNTESCTHVKRFIAHMNKCMEFRLLKAPLLQVKLFTETRDNSYFPSAICYLQRMNCGTATSELSPLEIKLLRWFSSLRGLHFFHTWTLF